LNEPVHIGKVVRNALQLRRRIVDEIRQRIERFGGRFS
jgi:hypothetical protein